MSARAKRSNLSAEDRDRWLTPRDARLIAWNILGKNFYDPCPSTDPKRRWAPNNGPWLPSDCMTLGAVDLPCFMNPPYSNLSVWCLRAVNQARRFPVLALLPSRTDSHWMDVCGSLALRLWFPRRRYRFLRPDGDLDQIGTSPPFGSVWILWGRRPRDTLTIQRFDRVVRDEGGFPLKVVGR